MFKALLRVLALIKKEFVAMWMDTGTRKILFIPILIQSLVFGYGASFNPETIPYSFYDEARNKTSTDILSALNDNLFKLQNYCNDSKCLYDSVNEGQALLGIYIKNDFVKDPTLFVITDARNTTSANIALGYLSQVINNYNQKDIALNHRISINTRLRFNENNISRFGIMTGMILALTMMQVMLLSSLSVSREREEGTFDMMLMTPTSPVEIFIGKAVPPAVIAVLQGLTLFLICRYYFLIPFSGSFFTILVILSLFSCSCVSIGLTVSAIAKTSQQSLVFIFTLILPAIILSGMLTPIAAMPPWFQFFTKLNPLYYGMSALQRVYLEGSSFKEIAVLMIPLLIVGAVSMPYTMYLFRHKLD